MSLNLLQESRRPQSAFEARAVRHDSSPKGCHSISTKFHGMVDITISILKNIQIRHYSWLDASKDPMFNQFRPIRVNNLQQILANPPEITALRMTADVNKVCVFIRQN